MGDGFKWYFNVHHTDFVRLKLAEQFFRAINSTLGVGDLTGLVPSCLE